MWVVPLPHLSLSHRQLHASVCIFGESDYVSERMTFIALMALMFVYTSFRVPGDNTIYPNVLYLYVYMYINKIICLKIVLLFVFSPLFRMDCLIKTVRSEGFFGMYRGKIYTCLVITLSVRLF